METQLLLKLAHLLAFVYWLGGDLGTFYASRFVVDPSLAVESRTTALKIMLGCDQGPKICMPLIFPIGYELGAQMQLLPMGGLLRAGLWLIALVWLGNVLYLYFTDNQAGKQCVTRFDFMLRIVVCVALLLLALAGLTQGHVIAAPWLAWKVLIFAMLVACGLVIRLRLKPFVAAFGEMLASGPADELNQAMSQALAGVRPFVYLIWVGLLLSAALGIHLI